MKTPYEAPAISTIGSLHDMTLQFKGFGKLDGEIFVIPNAPGIPIGDVDEDGFPLS